MKVELICTVCPIGCHLSYEDGLLTGNNCERGHAFMMDEIVAPKRSVSSTVKVTGNIHKRLPVKTSMPISKDLVVESVKLLDTLELSAPIYIGDIVFKDILGTGVDFIATRTIL